MAKLKTHKRIGNSGDASCGGNFWFVQLERRWIDVTCKNCLRKKK